jgi:hypothetical protein
MLCLPQNLKNGLVTEFQKKLKMQQTGKLMYGCNGQSRGIVTQQQQWKTIHVFPLTLNELPRKDAFFP